MNDSGSKEERLTLELLDAIERRGDVSQRHLAGQMGVALGLANSYLRRCAKKGLVKIREAPANRYFYYLTPKGFAEKARLTARFLSNSLSFYRQASESFNALYAECEQKSWTRLLLCGLSDLAEIALLRALESPLEVLAVYDRHSQLQVYSGRPVYRDLVRCPGVDAYIITGLNDPIDTWRETCAFARDERRVLLPEVLGIDGKKLASASSK